jgi:hypothetical protein
MKVEPFLQGSFYVTGRGPELKEVHFGHRGQVLTAIDYFDDDDEAIPEKHLVFIRPQVYMFTPEEVYNCGSTPIPWGRIKASMVIIHESPWLRSFAPQHLGKCHHYQMMFYDQYLDVICEGIEVKPGRYQKQV